MLGNSWVAEQQPASHEGCSFTELVSPNTVYICSQLAVSVWLHPCFAKCSGKFIWYVFMELASSLYHWFVYYWVLYVYAKCFVTIFFKCQFTLTFCVLELVRSKQDASFLKAFWLVSSVLFCEQSAHVRAVIELHSARVCRKVRIL
jgi:hypothetical protein